MRNLNNADAAARNNPCLKEQKLSYECLNRNGYDQEKCEAYFDNYNMCKKFWGQVYNDRRRKGVQPYLPDLEERDKIKEEYIKGAKRIQ